MTRQETLKQWLADRQRKYADGLALFRDIAPAAISTKYLPYLEQVSDEVASFDSHFTMLVNKLSSIEREIRINPDRFPQAFEQADLKELPAITFDKDKELSVRNDKIKSLTEEIDDLREQLQEAESSEEDQSEEIESLTSTLEEKEEEIARLQKELEELNKPGIKVVTIDSLPVKLQQDYARIREITPLYASLHGEIANESLTAEQRKPLADQLCKLDDERRKLWKGIDDWSEGKTVQLEEKRPEFSENPVVRGYEIARHIKRLKNNIATSKAAAGKAAKDGRQTILDNALSRIARYESELSELEKEVSENPE